MDGLQNSVFLLGIFILVQVKTEVLDSSLRLVGGNIAPPEFARFHASLQNLTGHHVCGGAVVSNQHVVTAGHCVTGAEPQYIKVVVGTTDLDNGGMQYDVVSVTVYDDFNFSLRTNDIAILKVNDAFDDRSIEVMKLDENELNEGDFVTLTGFGAQQPNGVSSRLMHVLNLTVFSQETCQFAMRYTREVHNNMFCTFTSIGEGTCHGDSGGPLVKNNRLVGLVSWGIPCASGFPDVHTRITPYIKWIKEQIGNV